MKIPDYVSPIVAYRVWNWDLAGLTSLNGERWQPGHAMTALCKLGSNHHQPPQRWCSCGIYSARSLDQLRDIGYAACAICGEVYLWGTVVEHEFGWRTQFAYPKSLVVPFEMIPVDEREAQSHLQALVAFGVDILIDDGKEYIPLWKKGSGYESAGLDYIRKVASGQVEVAVPIAVLKEDPHRHILLQNGRVVNHSAEIVFTDIRFPVNAPDPITCQLESPHVMVVVLDLRPGNARLTGHAISVIRMASIDIRTVRSNISIFVRRDSHNPVNFKHGMPTPADEYLDHDGRHDVQRAFKRFLRIRDQQRRASSLLPPGGASPSRGTPPGKLPPSLENSIRLTV